MCDGTVLAVPLIDLPAERSNHNVSVASINVIFSLSPCNLLVGMLVHADQVTEEDLFDDWHPSSTEIWLQITEGDLVHLDALGRKEAIFGSSGPMSTTNGGDEGLLLDAQLLHVRIDLRHSVCQNVGLSMLM